MFRNALLKALIWRQHSQEDTVKLKEFVEKVYGKPFKQIKDDPDDKIELTKDQILEFQRIVTNTQQLPSVTVSALREEMLNRKSSDSQWTIVSSLEDGQMIWTLQKQPLFNFIESIEFTYDQNEGFFVSITSKAENSNKLTALKESIKGLKYMGDENSPGGLSTLIIYDDCVADHILAILKSVELLEETNIDKHNVEELLDVTRLIKAKIAESNKLSNVTPRLA